MSRGARTSTYRTVGTIEPETVIVRSPIGHLLTVRRQQNDSREGERGLPNGHRGRTLTRARARVSDVLHVLTVRSVGLGTSPW